MKVKPSKFERESKDVSFAETQPGTLYTVVDSGYFKGTIYLCSLIPGGKVLVNLSNGGISFSSGGSSRFEKLPSGFKMELEQE